MTFSTVSAMKDRLLIFLHLIPIADVSSLISAIAFDCPKAFDRMWFAGLLHKTSYHCNSPKLYIFQIFTQPKNINGSQ